MGISEKEYKEALSIVDQYRKQLSATNKVDIYEWLKAEMMATTDVTLEEFENVLQQWININKKKLSIAEFEKRMCKDELMGISENKKYE